MLVVLTGGTGGAKLIEGLAAEIDPAELTIVCNTGDDAIFHGLHVSPDIDTITYTLAGIVDTAKGWGIKNDKFAVLEQLRRLGNDTWFNLGDQDLATHITRTEWLNKGLPLSEVTDRLRRQLGVQSRILPMSDQCVETRVQTPQGEISFQEFFVKERWARAVTSVRFVGAELAKPAPGVLEMLRSAAAIVICPSNPITSIGPIFAVPGIRAALQQTGAPVVGVSPIIGTAAISGPAHKLMIAAGFEASVVGVARCYEEILDTLLIADEDRAYEPIVERLGVAPLRTDIRMGTVADKRRLAREVLASAKK
jgi:LPPG:FO 2-phospho-L-lactate transferase